MNPTNKRGRLIESLYRKTLSNSIEWIARESDMVMAQIGQRIVRLTCGPNENLLEILEIANPSDGTILEKFNDEEVEGEPDQQLGEQSWYGMMQNLRELARRQATGADEAIDSVLKELGDF